MVVETKVRSGGVWRTITGPEVKVGGVWRAIETIQVRLGGVWRTVFESAVVTVSGESATDIGVNRASRAVIVVRQDGTIDKIQNVTTTQVDSATDWIIPNSEAPSDYQTRYTGLTGDPLDASTSAAQNVWRAISVGDYFYEQRATGNQSFSSTFTIQVRKGTGPVLDSASFDLTATSIIL